jgi:hypothetical protein
MTLSRYLGTAVLVALLASCGGGGGGGGSAAPAPTGTTGGTDPATGGGTTGGTDGGTDLGISGSGAPIAYGTIDGFGSIFVNGIEFNTDNAAIFVDGVPASEPDLSVGMVVSVEGTINEDGVTGEATVVIFDNELKGPIQAIAINAQADVMTITILDVNVTVDRIATTFENTTFDTLAVGDFVEISGFPEGLTDLRATHLEKRQDAYVEGDSEIEIEGTISALTDTTFQLRTYTVDYTGADLSEVADSTLLEGMYVEVKGTLSGDQLIATQVEEERSFSDSLEADDDFSLQGTVTNYVDDSNFEIAGVPIDASNAGKKPDTLVIADGVLLEVEGTWDGDILIATEIEAREGELKLEASVDSVDLEQSIVTLRLATGTVQVLVDSRTRFDDDVSDLRNFGINELSAGDFVEVEAYLNGGQLLATELDRDDPDDEIVKAPVDSSNPNVEITVLGLTYNVEGAEFKDKSDRDVDAAGFFGQLNVGDVVRIKDERPADGIAEKVSFDVEDD